MPKYKPMLIAFDEREYNEAIQRGNQKIALLNQAIQWAEKHIVVFDKELFAKSFTKFFMEEYYESNRDKIQLDIKIDKLLELVGINIFELRDMEDKFNTMKYELDYKDEVTPVVDKSKYERWTTSSEENEKLRVGRKLIESIKSCESHTKIYPFDIQRATGGFLQFNMRDKDYFVNI